MMTKLNAEDRIKLISAIIYGDIQDLLDVYKKYKLGFKITDPSITYIFCNCNKFEAYKCDCFINPSIYEIRVAAWQIAKVLYGEKFKHTILRYAMGNNFNILNKICAT